jgi:transposase
MCRAPTHKTLYNRFVCWSGLGVFARIFAAVAGEAGRPDRLMIDTTHRGASDGGEPAAKPAVPRCIRRTNANRRAE